MRDGLSAPADVESLLDRPQLSSVGEDTLIEGDLQRYGPAVN